MKYKAKVSLAGSGIIHSLVEGSTHNDDNYEGVIAFIPFTDQRFFEPIKTRTFQVEVSEEHMDRFDSLINDGFEPWTVTEITNSTLPLWAIEFMSQEPDCSIESFEGIDPVGIKNNFINRKLEALKWIKTHTNCGLLSAKRLTDYIWETF